MADRLTKEGRSKMMSAVRSSGTVPEILLRHALWRLGFRYRTNERRLPGSPDLVLPRYHTAIFVNGCFWHGHEGCKDYVVPKTNRVFWTEKIKRNRDRDQRSWRELEAKGWHVIVVWECELKKVVFERTVDNIVNLLTNNLSIETSFRRERRVRDEEEHHKIMAHEARMKESEEELLRIFGKKAIVKAPECIED